MKAKCHETNALVLQLQDCEQNGNRERESGDENLSEFAEVHKMLRKSMAASGIM